MIDLLHDGEPEWLRLESNSLREIREIEEAIWHGEKERPGVRDAQVLTRILDTCANRLSLALSHPDTADKAGPKGAYWLFEAGDYLAWTRSALYPERGEHQTPDVRQAAHCLYRTVRFLIRLGYSPDKAVPRQAQVATSKWPTHRVYTQLEDHVRATRREFERSSAVIRAFVFERDGYRCVVCQATGPLEVDHIVPVTKWGGNSPQNLQTLCKPCNIRKGNRLS